MLMSCIGCMRDPGLLIKVRAGGRMGGKSGGGARKARIWTSIGAAKSTFDELRAQTESSRRLLGRPTFFADSRASSL